MSEVVTFLREPRFERVPFDSIKPQFARGLVKGLMPLQGVGYIAGPSGSYKTFVALDWAFRIAEGLPILDRKTTARAVVYIAAEAPRSVECRVDAWRREHQRQGVAFELIHKAPDLRKAEDIEDLISELRIAADEFAARGPNLGLVVIDTLAASMPGGDENAGADMSAMLANVSLIAGEIGAFVLIVSHTGKDETRGLRGWSGQFAGADCVVMLTREAHESGVEIRIGKVAKLKDGVDGQRFAVMLKPVSLGLDEDGDEVSSAVIVYDDAPASGIKPRQRALNQPALTTLAALDRLGEAGRFECVPLPPGVKSGTLGVRVAILRQAVFDIGLKNGEEPAEDAPRAERDRWLNSRRKAFQRAVEDLAQVGRVRAEGGWIWRP